MLFKKEVAIVVDAYTTSGTLIAPALRGRAIDCVHVRSQSEVGPSYANTFKSQYFLDDILYIDLNHLLGYLSARKVRWVLPGSEMGVELSARLADAFDIEHRNNYRDAPKWRNKHVMHNALKEAGISSIEELMSDKLDIILEWIESTGPYPYVLKPLQSSGTDNVHICSSTEEVIKAFGDITNAKDQFFKVNREVLAQVYLRNTDLKPSLAREGGCDVEFCVNTISYAGRHYVSDIIRVYRKRIGSAPVHDYNELLCPVKDQEAYRLFSDYIFSVLDALRIRYGPAHSEVMLVNGQPVLLETAARLPGSNDMSAYGKALGFSQLDLWIMACTNPSAFMAHCDRCREPLRRQSSCVFLISEQEGDIFKKPDISEWYQLKTLHSISIQESGRLECTINLKNAPGFVFLLSDDSEDIARDRQKIRNTEQRTYEKMIRVRKDGNTIKFRSDCV